MSSQAFTSVDNNFTRGLITEATGLNFPENAATDTSNCEYTIIGDVLRREGIDIEINGVGQILNRTDQAITCYKWNNAGGDGDTQVIVVQIGNILYFYQSSAATNSSPTSVNLLSSTIDASTFTVVGATFDPTLECRYTDGNGYLFVFNENTDPFYCTYTAGTVTATSINIQIRDFQGIVEPGIAASYRPLGITAEHFYNLENQGWTAGNAWSASSSDGRGINLGNESWNIQSGLTGITNGQIVQVNGNIAGNPYYVIAQGSVVSYSAGVLTLDIFSIDSNLNPYGSGIWDVWVFSPTDTGYIGTWNSAEGNYPSNADVWWYFKNTSDVFAPASTEPNVTLSVGNAPKGHFVFSAFNQDRTSTSGVANLTAVTTSSRPTTGTWFQGRIWYSGVNDSQQATGDATFYTWSESIYFSQVNISSPEKFGFCYQVNDPTSENLFDILPTDGGVIQIPGSGRIHKLFAIANGMLIFAANGVWFLTGSQGIGFSANDYTITKISSVEVLSDQSFVDVLGLPYFWNQEGIYTVTPSQSGSLTVEPITISTILSFYQNIPILSKKYARAAYDPINYTIQWIYKTVTETSVTDRYTYDGILNFNTYTKAFFPYQIDITQGSVNSIVYIQGPTGTDNPDAISPSIKYIVSSPGFDAYKISFGDEHDTSYTDWTVLSGTPVNYVSTFTTGYKVHGKGLMKFQVPYVIIYSNTPNDSSYIIQSVWDYASSSDSNRWSTPQIISNWFANFKYAYRRHRLRGRGMSLQIKVTSVDGQPFDIIGWSLYDNINAGV